jgi:hypothetical protein
VEEDEASFVLMWIYLQTSSGPWIFLRIAILEIQGKITQIIPNLKRALD